MLQLMVAGNVRSSTVPTGPGFLKRRPLPHNNSFKPNPLRYSHNMAEKACHVLASTTQVGLIRTLGRTPTMVSTQTCRGCGMDLRVTREFFGNTPSGGFRRKCRPCMAAHSRNHAEANPENTRERSYLRQERERGGGPRYSDDDIAYLRADQDDRCAYCDCELDGAGHIDHMTPLAKGGTNERGNLVLACFQCNTEKHAKTAHDYFWWRVKRGLPVYAHAYAYVQLYGDP